MYKLALLAAMEGEIQPLVRGWKRTVRDWDGVRYTVFESGQTLAVAGGIGPGPSRRATEAVIRMFDPELVLSVGLAGALVPELKVGEVVWPRRVINVSDGSRTDTGAGYGVLLSQSTVVGMESKRALAEEYGGHIVDMESAAVAHGCELRGVRFGAVKAVSDELDFAMLPVGRFVTEGGAFRTTAFVAHVIVRPWLWGRVAALGRNSAKASAKLSAALATYIASPESVLDLMRREGREWNEEAREIRETKLASVSIAKSNQKAKLDPLN